MKPVLNLMLTTTLVRKSVPNMMSYLQLESKTIAFCSSIHLILSNSDSLMYVRVTTSAAAKLPANILSVVEELSFFGLVPLGKADLLISVLHEHESKRIRKVLRLLTAPILLLL